jgi:hypothetical protein
LYGTPTSKHSIRPHALNTNIRAHNKCLQRTQPDGEFLDGLQLSSVFVVPKEDTLVFVMQSFSLDLYSFSENAPDNGSLDYVRNVMIRHHEVFFIYICKNERMLNQGFLQWL